MKTVYVVQWKYNSGGGFNWYYDQDEANHAYTDEKENEQIYKNEDWRASLFSVNVNSHSREAITDEICNYLN